MASENWDRLKAALPLDEDWDVWINWYEDRLTGHSHSEEYELVFATVPPEVWDKGPAAANRWIKEHLPKEAPSDIVSIAQRIAEDPRGANIAIVDSQATIVASSNEDDLSAAQDPQTRQLHERTRLRADAARVQTLRLHNQGGFGNIAETVDEFARWIDGDTVSVAANISTVWELTVAIGTFIDRDDRARADPNDLTPRMDAAAREALDQLIIAAAPFVRRFPTALKNDEEWRAFKQPKEPIAASLRIVVAGRDAKLIEKRTGKTLVVALEASGREGPQAEKSRVWSLATLRKIVFAMFLCVAFPGEKFVEGVATKTSEKFVEKSQAVGRFVDYLLRTEKDILEALEGLPPDVGAAAREFLRRLRAGKGAPPEPPRSI